MRRHPALELAVRNAVCTECRLHRDTEPEDVCITGQISMTPAQLRAAGGSRIAIVTKFPVSENGRTYRDLVDYLTEAGIDHTKVMWLSAMKCRTYGMDPTKTDQKVCATYLRAEFAHQNFDYVLCLGAEAWFAASGWADITKHRGSLFNVTEGDGVIFPTISPSAVNRNPGLRGGFVADLAYFGRLIRGEGEVPDHHNNDGHVTTIRTLVALRDALRHVQRAWAVSYDIETTGAAEYDTAARIVSISLTVTDGPDMSSAHTYNIPLYHPESWFRRQWRSIIRHIVQAMRRCPRRIAHNAKYDTKWMQHFSDNERFTATFDTIIAAALLDENRPKGLKPLGQMILGAEPWGIDTNDLLHTPLPDVLHYNGLDTWHTLRLFFVFRKQLLEQPRLARVFKHLSIPLVNELCYVERRGVFVDKPLMKTNWNIVKAKLQDIHDELEKYVPEKHPFIKVNKRTGEVKDFGVNWNASNFARWFLFEHLDFPVLKRGKPKDDGTPGMPSMDEVTMASLVEMAQTQSQAEVASLLVDRVKWNKYDTAFFTPWSQQVDENSRMHSIFKPWGTVTGRLSSGKEDQEKVSSAKQNRGVNLQQVPRGDLTRGIFGAPPGSFFVEFDYSQVELRIAAFLAREPTMLHLYATGQDIHTTMAMTMTGKPWHGGKCDCGMCVTQEERKKAKAVNFGFLYGMGWAKFILTAWANYGVRVTEQEAVAFRIAFFAQFSKLQAWHARQRKLAHQFGRVETPMGRIRHLPDIYSPDRGVVSEAERQAINSPVQGFASDMCALSLVLLAKRFRSEGVRAYPIGTVHDAVNWEIHGDDLPYALPIIKNTMEDLPLEELFGINLDVPIIADCKVGTRWGQAKEVPGDYLIPGNIQSERELTEWLAQNLELAA
jgi:DNA polymerase I-like protein with 3'-5' exonuclease and polymerase domains/uracil-DNA glycosylase